MSRRASPDRFVVRGVRAEDLQERLGSDLHVRSVHTMGPMTVVEIEKDDAGDDPRGTWQRLRQKIGLDAFVAPVLVDDSGEMAYPTGQIQVRFLEAPSEPRRDAFAERNGMRVIESNRYQPAQCLFEPIDRAAYLPDVVEKLEKSDGVKRAWEVTEAHFKRGE